MGQTSTKVHTGIELDDPQVSDSTVIAFQMIGGIGTLVAACYYAIRAYSSKTGPSLGNGKYMKDYSGHFEVSKASTNDTRCTQHTTLVPLVPFSTATRTTIWTSAPHDEAQRGDQDASLRHRDLPHRAQRRGDDGERRAATTRTGGVRGAVAPPRPAAPSKGARRARRPRLDSRLLCSVQRTASNLSETASMRRHCAQLSKKKIAHAHTTCSLFTVFSHHLFVPPPGPFPPPPVPPARPDAGLREPRDRHGVPR